jgi:ATP-binding cassette subfamily F protein 3
MIHSFPDKEDLVYRRHLGMFGVTGNMQVTPIYKLSGGQKSRIAFAICVWNNPHILILDEPTNHLDLDAVNALIDAIKAF